MSLKSWTAYIVSTLLAVALTSYLLADEQTEPEPVKQPTEEGFDVLDVHDEPARTDDEKIQEAQQPADSRAQTTQSETDFKAEYFRKLEEAKQLVDNGQYAEAIKPLQQLTSMARHPSVHLLLGRCFEALDEYELALNNFSAAMIVPGATTDRKLMSEAYSKRGRLYLKLGRIREALEDFTQGVAQDPLNADLLYGRGLAQLEAADGRTSFIQDAIKSFGRVISIDDDHALAYYERGMAKAILGEDAGAMHDLKRAITVDDKGELAERLAVQVVALTQANAALKESLATQQAETEEVAKEGDESKDQLREIADTLRQIRDLLGAQRGDANAGTTGSSGDSANKGGFF
jgi:tetratricopeptide (TPR) repeat protein